MSDELFWKSATDLSALYRRREVSPLEVVESVLARQEEVHPLINAMVTITPDQAREAARRAEKDFLRGGELPALHGIPITVKDLTETAGVRTTYGTTAHADFVPDYDSIAWARLKGAGAILIGKTTSPEYGQLGVTESYLTGSTSTPWDVSCASGGSSGGAAAAVVAGIAPIAWGSDGGGSIRVPASLCGAVGVKPTAGRIPFANNSDADSTDGPLTRTVVDSALLLDITVGPHPLDRTALPCTGDQYLRAAREGGDLSGLRIAACLDFDASPLDPEVRRVFQCAMADMEAAGAKIEETSMALPDPTEFYLRYWGPESVAFFWDTFKEGGPIWPRIADIAERASRVSAIEASDAIRQAKTSLYNVYRSVFQSYDAIICPTTPITAFPHDDDLGGTRIVEGRKSGVYLHSLTEPVSHASLPAISVPCGFTNAGLPVGMQIIGPLYQDSLVISIAARYQASTAWHSMHPCL